MKRFHVHVGVADVEASVRFYSGLFGAEPAVRRIDYAKWMLDDPRVNFAISQRGQAGTGVDHLGLQAESAEELAGIRARFEAADGTSAVAEPNAACCYALSNKHWVTDPQGIAWEGFHTLQTFETRTCASTAGDTCSTSSGTDAQPARAACCDTSAASGERTQAGCCR